MHTVDDIQYVYDAGGNKVGVIVPIDLWERTLQIRPPKDTSCNIKEYYGIYRDVIKDPDTVSRELRDEWIRT